MLRIKSLPDSIELPVYRIALVGGAIPTFKAGEMVDVIYDGALGEMTIRKIASGTHPIARAPYPIFRDTAGNSTIANLGRTTVVKREWYGETDLFDHSGGAGDLVGQTAGLQLTVVGNASNEGIWAKAVAGEYVYGTLVKGATVAPAAGGVITVERTAAALLA